jgi:hypothetical protein
MIHAFLGLKLYFPKNLEPSLSKSREKSISVSGSHMADTVLLTSIACSLDALSSKPLTEASLAPNSSRLLPKTSIDFLDEVGRQWREMAL